MKPLHSSGAKQVTNEGETTDFDKTSERFSHQKRMNNAALWLGHDLYSAPMAKPSIASRSGRRGPVGRVS